MTSLQIFDDVRPELIPFLRDTILDRAARTPSQGSNNVGGWKSGPDLLAWAGAEIVELRRELVARLGAQPVAWAMVNRRGSFHARHVHGRTYQCGVYYVAPGDPPTPTLFEVPFAIDIAVHGAGTARASGGHVVQHVEPNAARLVLFPGGMWHAVPVYNGNEPRISIAFELRP